MNALIQRMRRCALYTFLFSLAAHGLRWLTLGFSGDTVLLSQTGEAAYQIGLGRFMQPVYWLIRGEICAPLTVGLFATAFCAGAATLICAMLDIRTRAGEALCCGLLIANEVMAAANATYLQWTDVYMLSLLLAVAGAYATQRWRWGFLLAPVLYSLSLGLYSCYLPAASTVIVLSLLMRQLRGERGIWGDGLRGAASIVLGLLLYALAVRVVLGAVDIAASDDYNGVGRVILPPLSYVSTLLGMTYTTPLHFLFNPAQARIIPSHEALIPAQLNWLLFGSAALLLARRARRLRVGGLLTLAFLLGILPLSVNFVQFISMGVLNGLTIYATMLLYLLPVALADDALTDRAATPARGRTIGAGRLIACLCGALACAVLGLNVRTAHQLSLKRELELSATLSAMTRILDTAEQTEGYVPGETPVLLVGMLPSSAIAMERAGLETLSRQQGARYTYAASYETANYAYLQQVLGAHMNLLSHEARQALTDTPGYADALSAYPQPGFCQMREGVLCIRLY